MFGYTIHDIICIVLMYLTSGALFYFIGVILYSWFDMSLDLFPHDTPAASVFLWPFIVFSWIWSMSLPGVHLILLYIRLAFLWVAWAIVSSKDREEFRKLIKETNDDVSEVSSCLKRKRSPEQTRTTWKEL